MSMSGPYVGRYACLHSETNFDLEDSDDLAALLGKRYGFWVAPGCTSLLYAVSIALDR